MLPYVPECAELAKREEGEKGNSKKKNAQCRSDKANEITNDAPAQRKNYGVARTLVEKEEVLHRGLTIATL